jgi:hypothetical protein
MLGPFVVNETSITPQLAHGVMILEVYPPLCDGNMGL